MELLTVGGESVCSPKSIESAVDVLDLQEVMWVHMQGRHAQSLPKEYTPDLRVYEGGEILYGLPHEKLGNRGQTQITQAILGTLSSPQYFTAIPSTHFIEQMAGTQRHWHMSSRDSR